LLAMYGPEADDTRAKVRDAVGDAIHDLWPEDARDAPQLAPNERVGNTIYLAIQRLSPRDDVQRGLKIQAVALAMELGELRPLFVAQSIPSLSMPMLITVDCWLVIIFVGFSLVAPRNATTAMALLAAAVSVVGALFLVLELDTPLSGFIRISSTPLI